MPPPIPGPVQTAQRAEAHAAAQVPTKVSEWVMLIADPSQVKQELKAMQQGRRLWGRHHTESLQAWKHLGKLIEVRWVKVHMREEEEECRVAAGGLPTQRIGTG